MSELIEFKRAFYFLGSDKKFIKIFLREGEIVDVYEDSGTGDIKLPEISLADIMVGLKKKDNTLFRRLIGIFKGGKVI